MPLPPGRDTCESLMAAVGCSHLGLIRDVHATSSGCEECLAIGAEWVHLRLCLSCGHVGCCDSSIHRHASAHARQLQHPLIRSLEPGEPWIWCYLDELVVASRPT